MTQTSHPVEDVLDQTDALLREGADGLRVSDLMDELGVKSIAAVLLAPSLALVSPLSGIPLFSSACGVTIALISVQMLMGRNHLWMPEVLSKRSLPADKTQYAIRMLRAFAAWLDHRFKRRLTFLLTPPFLRVIQGLCLLCGLIMPFLEIVPFTSSILGGVVALLALSMLTGDGLIALVTVAGLGLALGGAALHLL
ncbi:exopolysaccharide biosynthesis protein [Tritonibacter mobilis]|nr:exopolysaccharide biosynthesis protein [Tritonibacter mobilis]